MSSRTIAVTDPVHDYLLGLLQEPPVLQELRAETASMAGAEMQISPEQGSLMQLLVRSLGARRTLEIGTFTGYSALAVALALPPEGRVVACDVSEEWTRIARRYWEKAGVADRIELHLGPARQTLDRLISAGQAGYDFAFIDADKTGYDAYYERCLRLLRPGGMIAVDNALWGGAVADEARQDPSTAALRALNAKIASDPRVSASLVPIGDGLHLAVKLSG